MLRQAKAKLLSLILGRASELPILNLTPQRYPISLIINTVTYIYRRIASFRSKLWLQYFPDSGPVPYELSISQPVFSRSFTNLVGAESHYRSGEYAILRLTLTQPLDLGREDLVILIEAYCRLCVPLFARTRLALVRFCEEPLGGRCVTISIRVPSGVDSDHVALAMIPRMRIGFLLLAYFTFATRRNVAWPAMQKRDAPFEEARTRLDRDHSLVKGVEVEKYFREAAFASHYDGRFADDELSYEDRRIHLVALIQTYLSTMNDIGIETFIVHGTLLGWWWNRRIMPWDDDVDVMVTEKSIQHLASYYNMTVHHFRLPKVNADRNYLLEVNPHYTNSSVDSVNTIDARWIDTDTGLFIDITTLRTNYTAQALGVDGAMMVKDQHHCMYDDIFPLRDSTFEGFPVKVPHAYANLLVEEYGEHALTDVKFLTHKFDTEKEEWIALGLARELNEVVVV